MKNGAWSVVVLLLLVAMGVALVSSALLENQTWDEGIHLSAGYSYVALSDFRLNREHPPLGKVLSALPLMFTSVRMPSEHESWRTADPVMFGLVFLYRNNLEPDTMMMLGRLPTILMTLLLGVILAVWTKRRFGAAVAALAVFFFALDPNLIAHGRYVTTDLIATLTVFLSVVTWARFLRTRRRSDLAWAGVTLGLALATKFSTLFLVGLLPLLYLIRWWQEPRRYSLRHALLANTLLLVLGGITLAACYGPETWRTQHLPDHPYVVGLNQVMEHNAGGHTSYLLGEITQKGKWYYFPVAFAVKTPTAVLLLLGMGLGVGLWRMRGGRLLTRLREAPFPWIVIVVTPLAYLLLSMSGNLNLGLRHILPIYPFLFVIASATLIRWPAWPLVMLVIGLQVYEHTAINPHYLAFFNTIAGGPARGPAYLVDSNIDWGQDIKKLGRYKRENGIDEVLLSYFGVTDLEYYLGRHRNLHTVWQRGNAEELNAVVAISATILQGLYRPGEDYQWFRDREPDARIGYSIYVYDLREE